MFQARRLERAKAKHSMSTLDFEPNNEQKMYQTIRPEASLADLGMLLAHFGEKNIQNFKKEYELDDDPYSVRLDLLHPLALANPPAAQKVAKELLADLYQQDKSHFEKVIDFSSIYDAHVLSQDDEDVMKSEWEFSADQIDIPGIKLYSLLEFHNKTNTPLDEEKYLLITSEFRNSMIQGMEFSSFKFICEEAQKMGKKDLIREIISYIDSLYLVTDQGDLPIASIPSAGNHHAIWEIVRSYSSRKEYDADPLVYASIAMAENEVQNRFLDFCANIAGEDVVEGMPFIDVSDVVSMFYNNKDLWVEFETTGMLPADIRDALLKYIPYIKYQPESAMIEAMEKSQEDYIWMIDHACVYFSGKASPDVLLNLWERIPQMQSRDVFSRLVEDAFQKGDAQVFDTYLAAYMNKWIDRDPDEVAKEIERAVTRAGMLTILPKDRDISDVILQDPVRLYIQRSQECMYQFLEKGLRHKEDAIGEYARKQYRRKLFEAQKGYLEQKEIVKLLSVMIDQKVGQ